MTACKAKSHLRPSFPRCPWLIKPGKTEIEIANFLDFRMRELGAAGLSLTRFWSMRINSSKPHAHP